jgi:hypothetical protein
MAFDAVRLQPIMPDIQDRVVRLRVSQLQLTVDAMEPGSRTGVFLLAVHSQACQAVWARMVELVAERAVFEPRQEAPGHGRGFSEEEDKQNERKRQRKQRLNNARRSREEERTWLEEVLGTVLDVHLMHLKPVATLLEPRIKAAIGDVIVALARILPDEFLKEGPGGAFVKVDGLNVQQKEVVVGKAFKKIFEDQEMRKKTYFEQMVVEVIREHETGDVKIATNYRWTADRVKMETPMAAKDYLVCLALMGDCTLRQFVAATTATFKRKHWEAAEGRGELYSKTGGRRFPETQRSKQHRGEWLKG